MPTGAVRSSSYRYPCPSGTGLGYATFNDTIFLICDAAFSNEQFKEELALGLGLGLGLGIGIPFLVFFIIIPFLVRKGILDFNRYSWGFDTSSCCSGRVSPKILMPRESVEGLLSESALGSFRFGNLTEELKTELMVLRLREGRDLTEFVKFAEQLNYPELAEWIAKLNPGTIPPEIHQKVRNTLQVKVSEDLLTVMKHARLNLSSPNHELP